MFPCLEGMANFNAQMIDEHGNLSPACILDRLDSYYGMFMNFESLNASLCELQQRPFESLWNYYDHIN